jgi:regulator of protease activity HflC (stomatin/prohibitin superfamily)
MTWGFFISLFGALVAIAGIFGIVKGTADDGDINIRPFSSIITGIGVFVIAACCITTVEARHSAVEVEFGKPTATLGNGFHIVAPWSYTESFDATVQPLSLKAGVVANDDGDPVRVRLANGTIAEVEVSAQWQVDPDADIQPLFLDYRNFGNLDTNVVRRQLGAVLSDVFSTYDPLLALHQSKDPGDAKVQKLSELAEKAAPKLAAALPAGVKLKSLLLTNIIFSPQVQAQIDEYIAEVGRTQVAEQAKLTAQARAAANRELAVSSTWQAIVQNCLDMVERVTKGAPQSLPPGFSCAGVMQLALAGTYTQK